MIIVEFFSPPITGKSFEFHKLQSEFKRKKIKVKSYDDFFWDKVFLEKDISLINFIVLLYYKKISLKKKQSNKILEKKNLFKKENKGIIYFIKNKIGNFFYKEYEKILDKFYIKFQKKYKNLTDLHESSIQNLNLKKEEKSTYLRWFKETCSYRYVLEKYKFENILILQDEGFYQRLFLSFENKNLNQNLIKKYIKFLPTVDYIIYRKNISFVKKWKNERQKISTKFQYKNNKQFLNFHYQFNIVKKIFTTNS